VGINSWRVLRPATRSHTAWAHLNGRPLTEDELPRGIEAVGGAPPPPREVQVRLRACVCVRVRVRVCVCVCVCVPLFIIGRGGVRTDVREARRGKASTRPLLKWAIGCRRPSGCTPQHTAHSLQVHARPAQVQQEQQQAGQQQEQEVQQGKGGLLQPGGVELDDHGHPVEYEAI